MNGLRNLVSFVLLAKKLHCNKYTNRYNHMIGVGQMRIEIKVTRREDF